jgi:hypothetical protein
MDFTVADNASTSRLTALNPTIKCFCPVRPPISFAASVHPDVQGAIPKVQERTRMSRGCTPKVRGALLR